MTAARAALRSSWVLGGLVFALTWGGGLAAPVPFSLDVSSHAGFQMAVVDGLDFGDEIAFSYGPMGFLKTYLVLYEWPARLAALYGIALHLAVCVTLVHAARRSFPLAVAFVLALVVAMLMRGDLSQIAVRSDASVVVLTFTWCAIALTEAPASWMCRLLVFGGGAFAAVELLAKLNTGAIVLVLVTATVAALPGSRARNLGALGATFTATAAALWLATGHGLADIGPFVTATLEITSGYSTGARLEYGTRGYDYVIGPAVVAIAFAWAWLGTRGVDRHRRVLLLGLLAVVSFATFKNGFVSHEVFHMATFYATFAGICLAFRLPDRMVVRAGAAVAVAGICAATLSTKFDGYPLSDPIDNLRNGASSLVAYVVPGRLSDEVDENREELVAAYGLDSRTLELLEDQPVHVDPGETTAAWAYELEWRPLPVFQSYVASWTPSLDRRNADALASPDGPARILRQPSNPLGRVPGFESPAAAVAMLCNFVPLHVTQAWEVLGRAGDRCGPSRELGSATGKYGEPIAIPPAPPGHAVIGRVEGVQADRGERFAAMLHRGEPREVSLDGGPPQVFVGGAAENGLLLRAPAEADSPPPFNLAPNADTITFTIDGEASDREIEIDFLALPVRPREGPPMR